MDANIWTVWGICILFVIVIARQQYQIGKLKKGQQWVRSWIALGACVHWKDKDMNSHKTSLPYNEVIQLILQHLKVQVRCEKKDVTVIEKVPKPTKAQLKAMESRSRGIAGMAAQQPPYIWYNPQRGGIFG